MKNATINRPELLNEFEAIQVADYMERTKPNTLYTMTPGNDCVWVYYGSINLYFIFRAGKIADIQID
jgi:hypothetical protein